MDEGILVLLALIAVAGLFLGPIGFFLALGARSRLEDALRLVGSLEARLDDIQAGLERSGGPAAAAPSRADDAVRSQPDDAGDEKRDAPEDTADDPDGEPQDGLPAPPQRPAGLPPSMDAPPPLIDAAAQEPADTDEPESATAKNRPSLEERLGTRWTVWVGGAALALGALLMVRYAIDQGFFGPGARVLMGLALAVLLIGAGEKLRRMEKPAEKESDAETPSAAEDTPSAQDHPDEPPVSGPAYIQFAPPSIPAMLTAAGTVAAFGSLYAAHALYNFIGPAIAFITLGLVAVATMFAAALHGPMLAGLGLAGALGAPMLIGSANPSPWPVVLYMTVVAAAAYGLARLRRWLWLAVAAAAGGGLWAVIFALTWERSSPALQDFFYGALLQLILQAAMALYILAYEPYRNGQHDEAKIHWLPTLTGAGVAILAMVVFETGNANSLGFLWIASALILCALLTATGVLTLAGVPAVAAAGVFATISLLLWPRPDQAGHSGHIYDMFDTFELPLPHAPGLFMTYGLLAAAVVAAPTIWRLLRGAQLPLVQTSILAGAATLTPLACLVAAYARFITSGANMLPAAVAAGLAVAFTLLAHLFRNGVSDHKPQSWDLSLGIFASAAIAALALAFAFAFEGGTLTIALALAALGTAFVAVKLDIPALRWCVAGIAIVLAGRFIWEPRIVADLGPTPIFNWLLVGYGIPALAFGGAAWLMRRSFGEDRPVRIAQAMTILCSALLVYFQIRHFIFAGDALAPQSKLVEQGLFAIASFGFAIVLMRLDRGGRSSVMRIGSYLFGIVSAAISIVGIGLVYNPYFSWLGAPIEGGFFFNVLLLAYGLPGLAALLLGRMADGIRPRWYVMGARIVAMALIFGYLTLQVRFAFQGKTIGFSRYTSDGEWYAYSAVWLCFGIVLLAYGLWRKSVEIRIASALFIVLSVVKVFLFDLAGLDGILRAASFIGLGAVLIGIGLVYQKYVFTRPAGTRPPETVESLA